MRITCLIFLAVMSIVVVTECKPLSDEVEEAPCFGCEQILVRRKRCINWEELINWFFGVPADYGNDYSSAPNYYIGNGQNNDNVVYIRRANQVFLGNGGNNNNKVYYGY